MITNNTSTTDDNNNDHKNNNPTTFTKQIIGEGGGGGAGSSDPMQQQQQQQQQQQDATITNDPNGNTIIRSSMSSSGTTNAPKPPPPPPLPPTSTTIVTASVWKDDDKDEEDNNDNNKNQNNNQNMNENLIRTKRKGNFHLKRATTEPSGKSVFFSNNNHQIPFGGQQQQQKQQQQQRTKRTIGTKSYSSLSTSSDVKRRAPSSVNPIMRRHQQQQRFGTTGTTTTTSTTGSGSGSAGSGTTTTVPETSIHGRLKVHVSNQIVNAGEVRTAENDPFKMQQLLQQQQKRQMMDTFRQRNNNKGSRNIFATMSVNRSSSHSSLDSLKDEKDNKNDNDNDNERIRNVMNEEGFNNNKLYNDNNNNNNNDNISWGLHNSNNIEDDNNNNSANFVDDDDVDNNNNNNNGRNTIVLVDHNNNNYIPDTRQYRLKAVKPKSYFRHRFLKLLGTGKMGRMMNYERALGSHDDDDIPFLFCCCTLCGVSPNRIIINFLHWSFRRGFIAFLLSEACVFMSLVIIFAILIYGLGMKNPECIGGVGHFVADGAPFSDSFALSWTTFATVGYGSIYGNLSPNVHQMHKCIMFNIVISLEAFCGILFGSMCSAILFIKVSRIQSFAQVTFSDPIVVRYGSGVSGNNVDDPLTDDDDNEVGENNSKIPFPVLEFRIANRLHSVMGGEVVDCTLNIVTSIDSSQAYNKNGNAGNRKQYGKKGKRSRAAVRRRRSKKPTDTESGRSPMKRIEEPLENELHAAEEGMYSRRDGSEDGQDSDDTITLSSSSTQEGNIKGLVAFGNTKRIFTKLEVEASEHPFFTRVWTVRHKLNEDSPLLKSQTRQMLRKNNGSWPAELNNPESVRDSFHFEMLLVSFSGTSNADANSVYAQHIYDFDDVNIGYTFKNMLYSEEDEDNNICLNVDMTLLNKIVEQHGGGAEQLVNTLGDSCHNLTIQEKTTHHAVL